VRAWPRWPMETERREKDRGKVHNPSPKLMQNLGQPLPPTGNAESLLRHHGFRGGEDLPWEPAGHLRVVLVAALMLSTIN